MSDKPHLIWHSNAPFVGTGYGAQTALFTPRLRDDFNLVISAFYGLEGNIIPWSGVPVLPGIGGTHGDETIGEHAEKVFGSPRDGLILTLMDVWVLNPHVWRSFNVASWCPVDHQPVPGPVWQFFENSGAIPIAMSKFGQREMHALGLDPLYVPHAVDCSVLKPKEKAEARAATKMPEDAFIVGMVAANKGNPSRKCFQEAFEAFKLLHDRHPEAKLYLHTELSGRFQGVTLLNLLNAVGVPTDAVIACDQYRTTHFPFPLEVMADVYSSMDVLLAPSAGEGFGIPVVEAQACGTPVIVSDFSAQPELCGAGWTVDGTKVFTAIDAWQFKPDVADIYDALRQAYAMSPAARDESAVKAREFAEQYHVDHVVKEQMLPALAEVQERLDDRKPVKVAA